MQEEKKQNSQEEHFCSFFDDQPEVLRRFLPDGTITFSNDGHCSFFFRQKDITAGKNLDAVTPPEIRNLMEQSFTTLTIQNPERTYESLVTLPNGESRWIRWTNRAILNEEGKIVEYQSTGRDITDQKNTEYELAIRNRELAGLKRFITELMGSRDISQMRDVAFAAFPNQKEELGSSQSWIDTKESASDELTSTIKAAIRSWLQRPIYPTSSIVSIGSITIDFAAQRVNVDGKEIHLTHTEYRVLSELANAVGQVIGTDTILERVWGSAYAGESHLVWKVIRRLRQKIEPDPTSPQYIHNEHGRGYLLDR